MKHLPDSKIDFSDIPELTDQQLAKARRISEINKKLPTQLVAARMSPGLVFKLQKLAKIRKKDCQLLISQLLEEAIKVAA